MMNQEYFLLNQIVNRSDALWRPPESKEVEENKSEKWRMVLEALKDDEHKIYKEIPDAEMLQKDLIALPGFNGQKATRVLNNLEKRNFIERKSYEMANLVRLR